MGSKLVRKFTARAIFIIGIFLMILGTSFLFGFMEGTSRVSVFFSFMLVLSGAFCAFLAIKLNKQSFYLFFASFFLMSGIFLFLSVLGVIPLSFSEGWPLLSVFTGLALLPVGWRRTGGISSRYFVSCCAFVILGFILLVFSLKMVPFSFRQFIYYWWPMIFLLGGLTLVLISLSGRNISNTGGTNDEDAENAEKQEQAE